MVSSVHEDKKSFIFADSSWLVAYRLDATAAHMKTDLLERVYAEMSYTIWAMGLKKEKERKERKGEIVEHFQDRDEVVFPSVLCFIRFDIWAYSLVQRVNNWFLQCLYPISLY